MDTHGLIVGVNWLGDAIMATPALRAWRERLDGGRITVLSKPALAAYWPLALPGAAVLIQETGWQGMWRTIGALKSDRADVCRILPNSFRSALLPFMARIPERHGVAVQGRGWLLTHRVALPSELSRRHQSLETYVLLGLVPPDTPPALRLPAPEGADALAARLGFGNRSKSTLVGLLPGAARGASKRWPVERFEAVARHAAGRGWTVLSLGTAAEAAWCAPVAAAAGRRGINLAGRTSLVELAAVLSRCRAVVCNDSGGMHLAAAMGARVVAVFGLTDPLKTGPLGDGHRLLQADGVMGRRRIARHSPAAERALEAIAASSVQDALDGIMAG